MHKVCYDGDIIALQAQLESSAGVCAISTRNDFGWTPLHVSVFFNRVDIAKLLLSKGADICMQTVCGHTALHLACYRGNFEMIHLLISTLKGDATLASRVSQELLKRSP